MKCETPIWIKGQTVPCGKCSNCIGRKRNHWVIRLMEEAKDSNISFFLTLTYDDKYLVVDPTGMTDEYVLYYDHLRYFHREARKKGFEYKYFSVGEYGEKSSRPHYHMLVFSNQTEFDYQKFMNVWKFGFASIGSLTEASIKYCCKDMLKEVDLFDGVDKQFKPKIHVSNGMGIAYVEKAKYWHKVFYGDDQHKGLMDRNFYPQNNVKLSLPRYYSDRIYNKLERGIIQRLRQDDRSYFDILLNEGDKHALEIEKHAAQIYSQGVEQNKAKRLKIYHFGKKL